MAQGQTYTLGDIAKRVGAQIQGNPDYLIHSLGSLQSAQAHQLAFLANPRYKSHLSTTQAGAVLIKPEDCSDYAGQALIVPDPYAAFARLTHVFDATPKRAAGIHPSAVIDPQADIDPSAYIGPHVVVGKQAKIGAHSVLEASVYVGDEASIGAGCWIGPNVSIHHQCMVGDRVHIHAGASIGAEGFGFAPYQGRWHRIAQIGRVQIGDDSRIGANTTIDRGAIEDTVIGVNVIIDNQVQIAHNVVIGDHTAIAACCGIAGSSKIGRHCILAGGVGVVGHIEIADHVQLTGMTMVTKSITQAGSYSSGTAMTDTAQWKKMAVRLRQLADLPLTQWQIQLKRMQERIEQLESRILD